MIKASNDKDIYLVFEYMGKSSINQCFKMKTIITSCYNTKKMELIGGFRVPSVYVIPL